MSVILAPEWFLGFDVLIEIFSFIVLAVFSAFSLKSYRLDRKKKNFVYLGIGFGLIALAQLATILAKTAIYYDIKVVQQIGTAIITSNVVQSIDIFYYIGFFIYRFLTLAGLYIIYRLPYKKSSVQDYILIGYFVLLSAFVSDEISYLFNLTTLLILIMIISNYYAIYRQNRFLNTKILLSAFSILAVSQLLFVFSHIESYNVAGNIAELISYLILMALGIKIWKNGKKKKQDGDNLRHAGNNPGKRRKN